MIIIERQKVKQAFEAYTDSYDSSNPKIVLKREHTDRVAQLCQTIAAAEGCSAAEQDFAWLCGMLHDVGRFEQLKRYNTFIDAQSIDHAQFGASLLFEGGKIRDYVTDTKEDERIRQVVYWHSAYRLPEDMDDITRFYAQILRDADKIDILRVNIEVPFEEIYNVTKEQMQHAAITPEVLESFYEEHAVLRSLKKTPADNVVGHICLVYELVFPASVAIVRQQKCLEKLLLFSSQNPITKQQFQGIREHMQQYLAKKQR